MIDLKGVSHHRGEREPVSLRDFPEGIDQDLRTQSPWSHRGFMFHSLTIQPWVSEILLLFRGPIHPFRRTTKDPNRSSIETETDTHLWFGKNFSVYIGSEFQIKGKQVYEHDFYFTLDCSKGHFIERILYSHRNLSFLRSYEVKERSFNQTSICVEKNKNMNKIHLECQRWERKHLYVWDVFFFD